MTFTFLARWQNRISVRAITIGFDKAATSVGVMDGRLPGRFQDGRVGRSEMSDKKTIQHYESMTSAEILAELDRLGIDARPTIDAVKAIVGAHKHHHGHAHVHLTAAMPRGYARPMATARNHAAALQRGFFSSHDEAIERLQHSESIDAAYVHFGEVSRFAIEVSRHRESWPQFTASLARASARSTVPVQSVVVYASRHWLTIGAAMHELATATRIELQRHHLADEARVLLCDRAISSEAVVYAMGEDDDSLDAAPVAELVRRLHGGTPGSFIAMHALADVFDRAITLGGHDAVKQWIMDHIAHDHVPRSLALHSLAAVRHRHPQFAASLLADVVLTADHVARQIAFSMIVEGYERSFGGVQQLRVPQFEHGEHPRFVPGAHHELDLFGHRVCGSALAHELEEEMNAANHRLRLWS
ncbi:MAG TPA: hypothetical protein VEK57_04570 [Thermoanaerobaculia bacterium]|nr:hypothetical protein [Thermoanaerobaculia bacterium]